MGLTQFTAYTINLYFFFPLSGAKYSWWTFFLQVQEKKEIMNPEVGVYLTAWEHSGIRYELKMLLVYIG